MGSARRRRDLACLGQRSGSDRLASALEDRMNVESLPRFSNDRRRLSFWIQVRRSGSHVVAHAEDFHVHSIFERGTRADPKTGSLTEASKIAAPSREPISFHQPAAIPRITSNPRWDAVRM